MSYCVNQLEHIKGTLVLENKSSFNNDTSNYYFKQEILIYAKINES